MLMFVMSTNIFAQANRARTGAARKTTTVKKTTPARATTPAKPIEIKPVDMGLSVKWASSALGTTAANKPGKFLTRSEAEKKCKELGEGWRLPTQKEVTELLDNSYIEFILTNGKPVGVRCWSKKNHAALTFYFGECAFYGNGQKITPNPTIKGEIVSCGYFLPSDKGGWVLVTSKNDKETHKKNRAIFGNRLEKFGKNFGEWPDEAKKEIETIKYRMENFAGVSVDLSYIGIKQECNYEALWSDAAKLIFTPVYDVNDDE